MVDTVYDIAPKENRQAALRALEIGDSISISRRVAMQHGFADGAIAQHTQQVSGILHQQVNRVRRHPPAPGVKYTVESGSFVTQAGALIITAVATRTA